MLLRTSVNLTLAIPTLWHLWVIAIAALSDFSFRRLFSQYSCTQESPNTTTLLLSAGILSLIWASLPYQSILFCHKNSSCCPWVLSLTHPGSHVLSITSSSDYHCVDDKLCPNSKSWDTPAQAEAPFATSIPVPSASTDTEESMPVMKYLSLSEQRNQLGRQQG